MSVDKRNNLIKYIEKHKQLLQGPIPPKHSHRVEIYHDYLRAEIRRSEKKMEGLKK